MDCKHCGGYVESVDYYCRKCGAHLESSRLPVVWSSQRRLAVSQQARPLMWRGVSVVAGTLLVELLRRRVIQPHRLIGIPLALLKLGAGKVALPDGGGSRQVAARKPEVEVSETILYVERKVRR